MHQLANVRLARSMMGHVRYSRRWGCIVPAPASKPAIYLIPPPPVHCPHDEMPSPPTTRTTLSSQSQAKWVLCARIFCHVALPEPIETPGHSVSSTTPTGLTAKRSRATPYPTHDGAPNKPCQAGLRELPPAGLERYRHLSERLYIKQPNYLPTLFGDFSLFTDAR